MPNLGSSLFIPRGSFEIFKPRFEPLGADEAHVVIEAE